MPRVLPAAVVCLLGPAYLSAMMYRSLCLLTALVLPAPILAHPHIFVETGVRTIHDPSGALTAIEITWTYDELFSLLLLEDLELDNDFDGVLTPQEVEVLQGFDMDWPDGYEGDVYISTDGAPVALGDPVPGRAELNEKGQLIGRHIRQLTAAVSAPLSIRVYDPSYYTAYEVIVEQVTTNTSLCGVEVFTPDLDAAFAQLEAALDELIGQSDFDQEINFPAVGDRFADEIRLTCDSGS